MQTSDSRKRQAERADVEVLAEELCRYDDSLHHMEATDDFPCWHCEAKARAVLASDWLAADRARVWDEGYQSGLSNAMRRMSDEPTAPTTPNPYQRSMAEAGEPDA